MSAHKHETHTLCHIVSLSPPIVLLPLTFLVAYDALAPEKVKRHAALVLGNMCQTDSHRATAGEEGAVEGLFALCDTDDGVVRANALWALGNLAWDPRNQVIFVSFTKSTTEHDCRACSGKTQYQV